MHQSAIASSRDITSSKRARAFWAPVLGDKLAKRIDDFFIQDYHVGQAKQPGLAAACCGDSVRTTTYISTNHGAAAMMLREIARAQIDKTAHNIVWVQ